MKLKYIIYLSIIFLVFLIVDIAASNLINVYLTPVLVSFLIIFIPEKESIYFIATFAAIFDTIFSYFVGFYLFIALLMLSISYIIKQFYSINKVLLYVIICAISEFLLIVRISFRKGIVFAIVSAVIVIAFYPLLSRTLKNAEVANE